MYASLERVAKKRGITQEELAKQLQISPSTIGMYETFRREPDIETLIQMADFFHVTIDELVGHRPQLLGDPLLLGHHGDKTYELAVKIYRAVLESPEIGDIFCKIMNLNKKPAELGG